ncbi:response regulator transcription factor [Collinsella tanakaei]|uniref:response regulator transcription factor n=1 Tax=Collinsella tanakaei TaxID=626935 RepID=UPI0025A48FDA|nr:response regulator transcription factor [Collinsella tanakaei]MDM8300642.1 response regulator transcription factor [Collinsella tanakaei]
MSLKILVVEDDPFIVTSLTELLASEGYAVDHVAGQTDAIARIERNGGAYALVLLDVTLAQGNGFATCSAIKQLAPELPVIFLTASDDEFDTVTGLTMGADDYVAKPFRPRELLARIAATIRRSHPAKRIITFGPLTIDTERAHVERTGVELVLSALEYRLLLLFATNQGKLITREQIRCALWDDAGTYIEENTLSVYIKRLRDKIEDDPAHPELIQTVRGLGYKAHE